MYKNSGLFRAFYLDKKRQVVYSSLRHSISPAAIYSSRPQYQLRLILLIDLSFYSPSQFLKPQFWGVFTKSQPHNCIQFFVRELILFLYQGNCLLVFAECDHMKSRARRCLLICLLCLTLTNLSYGENKFRERKATDDELGYPEM